MRGWVLFCLISVVISSLATAQARGLSRGAEAVEQAHFQDVARFEALPSEVQAFFMRRFKKPLSPVGGVFNDSGFTTPDNAPTRRLIKLGHDADLYYVWYEHGGVSYHQHFVLVRAQQGKVDLVYAVRPASASSIENIKKRIAKGRLREETAMVDKHKLW